MKFSRPSSPAPSRSRPLRWLAVLGVVAVLTACKTLAQRIEFLQRQANELTTELDAIVTAINPALRAARPSPRRRRRVRRRCARSRRRRD